MEESRKSSHGLLLKGDGTFVPNVLKILLGHSV